MRLPIRWLFVFLGVMVAAAGAARADARRLIDPTGRTVQVPSEPRRVVALAPSITEMVFALKQQDRLVGVARLSTFPSAARKLPQIGSYIQPDVERIAALRPDLVIAIKDGNPLSSVEQLSSLGIPVYAVDAMDLQGVMQSMLALGELLGAPEQAGAAVAGMQARINAVQSRLAATSRRPRVFFQIGIAPIVSVGSKTFIHTLIELAGGMNVAAGPTAYPRFSREQVIALAPEVMVISSMERFAQYEQVKREWMKWPALPAVRDQAIFIAPPDLFDRPSPRLVDALELLAGYIHPELFKERP